MNSISGIGRSQRPQTHSLYRKIASGKKLHSAADGAAALSIAKKQETQVRGYHAGTNNLKSGQSLLNVSDGALGGVSDYLQRIRELAVQASNTAVVTDSDRVNIQKEIDQMKQGISDIASQTQFNTKNLLDGSSADGLHIAADSNGASIKINGSADATLKALGIADFDVTKDFDLNAIDIALDKVNSQRSTGGAQFNRLGYARNYNSYASYNTSASRSRLEDTDYPKAVSDLKKKQALSTYSLMMQKRKMQDATRNAQNFWLKMS